MCGIEIANGLQGLTSLGRQRCSGDAGTIRTSRTGKQLLSSSAGDWTPPPPRPRKLRIAQRVLTKSALSRNGLSGHSSRRSLARPFPIGQCPAGTPYGSRPRSLRCSSSPHRTRFAGLRRGPHKRGYQGETGAFAPERALRASSPQASYRSLPRRAGKLIHSAAAPLPTKGVPPSAGAPFPAAFGYFSPVKSTPSETVSLIRPSVRTGAPSPRGGLFYFLGTSSSLPPI